MGVHQSKFKINKFEHPWRIELIKWFYDIWLPNGMQGLAVPVIKFEIKFFIWCFNKFLKYFILLYNLNVDLKNYTSWLI